MADRISIILFVSGLGNTDKLEIDLSQTSFLKKGNLKDGEPGYVLSGNDSPRLYSVFNDYKFLEVPYKISIKDGTGKYGIAEDVSKVLEVLGTRASSIVKEEVSTNHCKVQGVNLEITKKLSRVFYCDEIETGSGNEYEFEIFIGKDFLL